MQLQEYFAQQRNFQLSDEKKSEIFRTIRRRRFTASVAKRGVRSYKTLFASLVILVVFFGMGGIWIQQKGGISTLFPQHHQPLFIPGTASADYIAQIVEVKGDRHLEANNPNTTTGYLHNGDIVYLQENTKMVFSLDDGAQANIVGPAVFSLSKEAEKAYQLKISKGRFIKLTHAQPKNSWELVMDDITLTTPTQQPLHLQIAKNGQETLIQNHGAEIAATMLKTTTTKSIAIAQETIALRPNDLRHISDPRQFALFLEHNNLSEVFSLEETIESGHNFTPVLTKSLPLPAT